MTRLRFSALAVAGTLAATSQMIALSSAVAAGPLGTVDVRPARGTDTTLLSGGVLDARCPKDTVESFFDVIGRDVGMSAKEGSGDLGYLGPGSRTGQGRHTFKGVSIANLKTTNSGAFSQSGRYVVRFVCIDPAGATSATYERALDYDAVKGGRFAVAAAPAGAKGIGVFGDDPDTVVPVEAGVANAGPATAPPTGSAPPASVPSAAASPTRASATPAASEPDSDESALPSVLPDSGSGILVLLAGVAAATVGLLLLPRRRRRRPVPS